MSETNIDGVVKRCFVSVQYQKAKVNTKPLPQECHVELKVQFALASSGSHYSRSIMDSAACNRSV